MGIDAAAERYAELHWGDEATEEFDLKVVTPGYPGVPFWELRSISYVASKDGKGENYVHGFGDVGKLNAQRVWFDKGPDGRGPFLMRADGRGNLRFPGKTSEVRKGLVALGRVLDFESVDGERIFAPFYWIVTYAHGDRTPVLLASANDPLWGIEHHQGHPFITAHGIVG